jgi:uncharacterized Rmd1/YagE family protein
MKMQASLRQVRDSKTRRSSNDKAIDTIRRKQRLLVDGDSFEASAVMIAERIDLNALSHLPAVAESPLTVRLPSGGVATLFRYGAIALFREQPGDRDWLLSHIGPHCSGSGDEQAVERIRVDIDLAADEGPGRGGRVTIHSANRERIQLLAEAMAKSAMLSFQENRAAGDFDRIEPLAQDLADDGRFSIKPRELLKTVGGMLLSEHRLTGRAEVMDKPEVLWDNSHLEGLYARLAGDYELEERALAIERKLATLAHTAETLVETIRYQISHRLEFYVVVLILLELFLSVYGHFR